MKRGSTRMRGIGRRRAAASMLHGTTAPGFEAVAEAFASNFSERGEVGAACAVYHRGVKVVDLWGGYRDVRRRAPWAEDTLVLVFSTTKGLSAMTCALAHSRGWLDYEATVAAYWPAFARHGKGAITVRQLLAHQAGLPVLDVPVPLALMADLDALAAVLARQRPVWTPGTVQGYHTATLGLYTNELIRRVDPRRRTLGQFFRDEIAAPLGLEFYIGLPEDVPDDRLAALLLRNPLRALFEMPWPLARQLLNRRSLLYRSLRIPCDARPTERRYCAVESPSTNGVGQVRAIARAYSVFAAGGGALGLRPETLAALTAPPEPPPAGPRDALIGIDLYFSLGFSRPGPRGQFGGSPRAFGTPGLGGSLAFADPAHEVSFAYACTKMGYRFIGDPRHVALQRALYRCLERL